MPDINNVSVFTIEAFKSLLEGHIKLQREKEKSAGFICNLCSTEGDFSTFEIEVFYDDSVLFRFEKPNLYEGCEDTLDIFIRDHVEDFRFVTVNTLS